jgi:hypothetical protein
MKQRPKCTKCGDYHWPSEPHRNLDDEDDRRPRPRRPKPRPLGGAPLRQLEEA